MENQIHEKGGMKPPQSGGKLMQSKKLSLTLFIFGILCVVWGMWGIFYYHDIMAGFGPMIIGVITSIVFSGAVRKARPTERSQQWMRYTVGGVILLSILAFLWVLFLVWAMAQGS
jgi:hypothetical protein